MKERRCVNCMELMQEHETVCPHCGFDPQRAEQSPFGIKWNTILRGRYLVGRILGQGGFGITYVGYDIALDVKVAIKEYFPMGFTTRNSTMSNEIQWNTTQVSKEQQQKGCDSFLKEARRMAKIDSLPGIVRVRDTFVENQTAYIVMDFIEGVNLKQRLREAGPMSFAECRSLLAPLMGSLARMHEKGLIHRDISPDNIMIQQDGTVWLLDFGAAKDVSFQQNAASQQVTKKGFSPPEQYQEKGNIGPWTDVYALCATIYYCVTGKMVPDAMDRMYEDTLSYLVPGREPLSGKMADVLSDGLELRIEKRIKTVDELLKRLWEADYHSTTGNGQAAGGTYTAQSTGNQPIGSQPTGKQQIWNQPAGSETIGNQPIWNRPAGSQTTGNQFAGNQPIWNQSAGSQTTGNQSVTAGRMSQKEFLRRPEMRTYALSIRISAVCLYVYAGIFLIDRVTYVSYGGYSWWDVFVGAMIEVPILVGLWLGVQLRQNRACAVLACVWVGVLDLDLWYGVFLSFIDYLILLLPLLAAIFAAVATFRFRKAWEEYQRSGMVPVGKSGRKA